MAQPILLELPPRDAREALYDRLKNAPHEHAEALLTVYDMAKALDRGMTLSDISLAEKSGGTRGDFSRVDGTSTAT